MTRVSILKKVRCEMAVVPSKASALRRWRMIWAALGPSGSQQVASSFV
jgi:hypothetical protein